MITSNGRSKHFIFTVGWGHTTHSIRNSANDWGMRSVQDVSCKTLELLPQIEPFLTFLSHLPPSPWQFVHSSRFQWIAFAPECLQYLSDWRSDLHAHKSACVFQPWGGSSRSCFLSFPLLKLLQASSSVLCHSWENSSFSLHHHVSKPTCYTFGRIDASRTNIQAFLYFPWALTKWTHTASLLKFKFSIEQISSYVC